MAQQLKRIRCCRWGVHSLWWLFDYSSNSWI